MDDEIDSSLVHKLIAKQFPDLGDLPLTPIEKQGHDNRTFRLGSELTIRIPSQPSYAAAVQKEATALAAIYGRLTVDVPKIFAMGEPSKDYPLPWSIRYWLAGTTLEETNVRDQISFAKTFGAILAEFRDIPIDINLSAGRHSFYRGCHPSAYSDEVVRSLSKMNDLNTTKQCLKIWQKGISSVWCDEPTWFHGDVAVGNVLMSGEVISALIDFGTCGVGDPACDFAMAWTYFNANERQYFRDAINIDNGTWDRAKAWALWKALVSLNGNSIPDANGIQARALKEILNEET